MVALVLDHQLAVDDIDVPLVQLFVASLQSLISPMPEDHKPAGPREGDHLAQHGDPAVGTPISSPRTPDTEPG